MCKQFNASRQRWNRSTDLVPKDRISDLPDDILYHVLSYLDLREAAHASLLSKRYRYNYLYRTRFRFEEQYHYAIRKDKRHMYEHSFVRRVNQFIQSYKGTRLDSLDISFCLHRDFTYDIDHWLRFAVSKNVEDLSLNLNYAGCFSHCWMDPYHIHYTFPTELLSPKLRYLLLKSVKFSSVPVGHVEVKNLFSSCSNLESLSLFNCELPAQFHVTDSLHLKFLTVYNCRGLKEINLIGANVISFEYVGHLIQFSFSEISNLQKLYFSSNGWKGIGYAFSKLVKDLPAVKSLVLNTIVKNWGQYLPDSITTFTKVTELSIFFVDVKFDAAKLILILKACPNLENLHIMIATIDFKGNAEGLCKSDLMHLKEIHIGGFYFHESCIDFATYMLENVTSLERMVIDPVEKFYVGIQREQYGHRIGWDEGERQAVCERLEDYYSKSAQIFIH